MSADPPQPASRPRRRIQAVLLILAIVALLVFGILIPILHRYRELASRDPCASNLRQLGQALLLHQQAHGGIWPVRLEELVPEFDMNPVVLTCIVSEKPFVFVRPGASEKLFRENDVIAYEPPEYHDHRGAMVLFGDGHVSWLTPGELKEALARAAPTTRATTSPASAP